MVYDGGSVVSVSCACVSYAVGELPLAGNSYTYGCGSGVGYVVE